MKPSATDSRALTGLRTGLDPSASVPRSASRRPAVLVLSAHYLPGVKSGGPVRSLGNLVSKLRREYRFFVIARDRDHGEINPYAGIRLNVWSKFNGGAVFYASNTMHCLGAAVRLAYCRRPLVYINSVFHFAYAILPLVLIRLRLLRCATTLVAPRGEFSLGALAIRRFKKVMFLTVTRFLRLYEGVHWHATSPGEAVDIVREMGGDSRCITAGNIVELGPEPMRCAREAVNRNPLSLVFVSRIQEKKNLLFALSALQHVKCPVMFAIYGPIEEEWYWKKCLAKVNALPSHVRVAHMGVIAPDEVRGVLERAHLFYLPTRGENFGHAIAEAFAAGLPVLISDQTPWRNLESAGIGWDLPLDEPLAFAQTIEKCASMEAELYLAIRAAARRFSIEVLEKPQVDESRRMLSLAHSC